MMARDEGCSADFRYNRLICSNLRSPYNLAAKYTSCSQDTFNNNLLPINDFALSVMQSQPPRATCTCWRAVYLSVREDTDVTTTMGSLFTHACPDHAIHKAYT